MSIKTDGQSNTASSNASSNYSNSNNQVTKSLDQTKENINRSIDESLNQISRYNDVVSSYQEQSLQTAKQISEDYLESQKAVTSTLQSAWRQYIGSFNGLVTGFASPDSMTKAYAKLAGNFADNAVSAMRLTNCFVFSNIDSMKSTLQQAKDNSKNLSNLTVSTAKTFEQSSRELAATIEESVSNYNNNNNSSSNKRQGNSDNDSGNAISAQQTQTQ